MQVSRGHAPGYVIYYEKSTISPRDELVNLLHFSGLDCDRSWPGDMIGIYVEESWDGESGAHSKDYGCHTWNVTPLCE